MIESQLTTSSFIAIVAVIVMYGFLMAEKINKVLVVGITSFLLIFLQIYRITGTGSQTEAFSFVARNLDVLGFIIGMMVLVGIVKESGFFEAVAIWLVKRVKGNPRLLLITFGYLALVMTIFLSNIPTILILTPVLLVLIKELKLPYMPYFVALITMANIAGATTPISDPTTYYQAKTVGLSFVEVVTNSGFIVLILSVVSMVYMQLLFGKQLDKVHIKPKEVAAYKPSSAIKDRKILRLGLPLLFIAIAIMLSKDWITGVTGITLDNASITLAASCIAILLFEKEIKNVFQQIVDWEIIFFFMGLFIVIGSLEQTGVVNALAGFILNLSQKNVNALTFLITMGSSVLSVFIDNVPYNITMVSAIQAMEKAGIFVYPLWWALNLGTSIGGAGSPIGSACNVVALGQAEKEKIHIKFLKYLGYGLPLVIINGLVTFVILYIRYGILAHH
jgi:Na+/H+ antiporter NhaD/arsenite permease-like protein